MSKFENFKQITGINDDNRPANLFGVALKTATGIEIGTAIGLKAMHFEHAGDKAGYLAIATGVAAVAQHRINKRRAARIAEVPNTLELESAEQSELLETVIAQDEIQPFEPVTTEVETSSLPQEQAIQSEWASIGEAIGEPFTTPVESILPTEDSVGVSFPGFLELQAKTGALTGIPSLDASIQAKLSMAGLDPQ